MKRTFAFAGASALVTMCILGNINPQAIKAVFVTAFVAFFIFVFIKKIRFDGSLPIIAFTVCCCCLLFSVYDNSVKEKINGLTDRNETHVISGEVVSLPNTDNGRFYYIIRTDKIDGRENKQKIRLSFSQSINAGPFDKVSGEVHLYKLGEQNEEIEDYYSSKGLFLGGYSYKTDGIKVSPREGFHPMYYVLSVKSAVIDAIKLNIPNEYGSLLTGFLLGEKSSVSDKTLNAFSLIGSYHLLAVSGLHVTVWTGFVYALLRALKLKRKLCCIIPVLFVLFFMALTGFNPPVVRAGMLMIFVFLGMLSGREADSLNSIGLAVTLMILINPYAAFSKSLWLSVFASSGIIILSGKMKPKTNEKQDKNKFIKLAKTFVVDSVAVSLSVALFTLPLTLVFFDRFSLVTPIANLVLIEISSLAMLLIGFAVLLFITGLHFISYPLFFLSSFLAKIITDFACLLSKLPYITISTDWLPLQIITALIPLIAIAFYLLKKYKKDRLFRAFCVLVAVTFVTVCISGIISGQRRTRIYIPAVGNGMCAAVVDKKNTAVIGCGGNYFAYSSFCAIMSKEGISKLDFVFVPSENKSVYSFFDDVKNGFDIDTLKNCEYGFATLESGTKISCEKDYAFIDCQGVTVLVIFNYNFNLSSLPEEYKKADYLFTRFALPEGYDENSFGQTIMLVDENPENNNQSVIYAGNEIIYLEVEQNGRARLETAN